MMVVLILIGWAAVVGITLTFLSVATRGEEE